MKIVSGVNNNGLFVSRKKSQTVFLFAFSADRYKAHFNMKQVFIKRQGSGSILKTSDSEKSGSLFCSVQI